MDISLSPSLTFYTPDAVRGQIPPNKLFFPGINLCYMLFNKLTTNDIKHFHCDCIQNPTQLPETAFCDVNIRATGLQLTSEQPIMDR